MFHFQILGHKQLGQKCATTFRPAIFYVHVLTQRTQENGKLSSLGQTNPHMEVPLCHACV